MKQNNSGSVRCLWVIWLITCLAVPFLPLSKIRIGQDATERAAWLAFGIVAAMSVFLAAYKAKGRPWTKEWIHETLRMALGLTILGSAISTAFGSASCVVYVLERL